MHKNTPTSDKDKKHQEKPDNNAAETTVETDAIDDNGQQVENLEEHLKKKCSIHPSKFQST